MEGSGNRVLTRLDLMGNSMPLPTVDAVREVLAMSPERRERRLHLVWKQKPVECRLGCGVEDLFELQQFRHETRDCPCRQLPCPLGCGEVMMVR